MATRRAGCGAACVAPHSPGQDQLSYQLIFFLYLPAEVLQCGFLHWTNAEAAFGWPATMRAKIGGIRELKTTVQTLFDHRCSPHLSSARDSEGSLGCSHSTLAIQLASYLLGHSLSI